MRRRFPPPGRRQLKRGRAIAERSAAGQQRLEKPARRLLFAIGIQRDRQVKGYLAIARLQGMGAVEQLQTASSILC